MNSLFSRVVPVCLALFSAVPAYAMMLDYTPISAVDRKSTVALRHVLHDQDFKGEKKPVYKNIAFAVNDDSELVMSGKDLSGKPWKVVKRFCGLGTEVYACDLDGNGFEDLVLMQANGGCGMAPFSLLTTIFFDEKQHPHFFELYNYGDLEKKECVSDLLQVSGKAVLVVDSIVYHTTAAKTYSYWQTCLYEARDSGYHFLPLYHGKRTPLLVRYRFKNNHELVRNPPADVLAHRDLTVEGSLQAVKIKSLKLTNGYFENIDFGSGVLPSENETPLFTAVVSAEKNGEYILAGLDTKAAVQLLGEAYEKALTVKIPGKQGKFLPSRFEIIE